MPPEDFFGTHTRGSTIEIIGKAELWGEVTRGVQDHFDGHRRLFDRAPRGMYQIAIRKMEHGSTAKNTFVVVRYW